MPAVGGIGIMGPEFRYLKDWRRAHVDLSELVPRSTPNISAI